MAKYRARRDAHVPEAKTCCKYGHEWISENILTDAYGRQYCKICRKAAAEAWYTRKKTNADPLREKRTTHCKRGHELIPENVYVRFDKKINRELRSCRQCKKDYVRTYKRKKF